MKKKKLDNRWITANVGAGGVRWGWHGVGGMRESLVSFVFFFLYKKKSDYIDGFDGSALGYIFEKGIGGVMHRCPDSMSTARGGNGG